LEYQFVLQETLNALFALWLIFARISTGNAPHYLNSETATSIPEKLEKGYLK
jgi:hypothetical protein